MESRPLWKRAKFVSFIVVCLLLVGSIAANAISPGAVQPDVQSILAGAIAVGLPAFQWAQGAHDKAKAQADATFSE